MDDFIIFAAVKEKQRTIGSEIMANHIEAPFVFGVRVEGDAFTDRREETERLKANFTSYEKNISFALHVYGNLYDSIQPRRLW